MEKLIRTGDLEAAEQKVAKFLLGSRSDLPLPWGGNSSENPVHVMEMIRQAEAAVPGTMATYEFLCNASHPCYLQHAYLVLAGSHFKSWSNAKFASHSHQTLNRTLEAAEDATRGIAKAGIVIMDTSMPIILAERGGELSNC